MTLLPPRRLTFLEGNCYNAAFSPNGSCIAFVCSLNRCSNLYVINTDGTELRLLAEGGRTEGEAAYGFPQFSPDGAWIVCTRSDPVYAERSDISLLPAGGGTERVLTQGHREVEASFSPDGNHIFFASGRDGQSEIYRMNADGSNQKRLTHTVAQPANPLWLSLRCIYPRCTPDGEWILFASSVYGLPDDNRFEIARMRPDGSEQQRLSVTQGSNYAPFISPDGRKIAFTSWGNVGEKRQGKTDIYQMNLDGLELECLEESPFVNWIGSFSPDGRWLAFDSTRGGEAKDITRNWDIYLYDLMERKIVRLTENAHLDRKPLFSPDGNSLLFQSDCDGKTELYLLNPFLAPHEVSTEEIR